MRPARVQAEEVGWGQGGQADVALDPPTMRQAIGWSFALRNIRRKEAEEVGEQLRRETGAEAVRDVKARPGTACPSRLDRSLRGFLWQALA